MWKEDNQLFEKLVDQCGNRYLATKFIAKRARELAKTRQGYTMDSSLVTWALTGKEPKFHIRPVSSPEVDYIEDTLCYVDNLTVRKEVRRLYVESVKKGHLVYTCKEDLDPFIQSRIRVILRMIWYHYEV